MTTKTVMMRKRRTRTSCIQARKRTSALTSWRSTCERLGGPPLRAHGRIPWNNSAGIPLTRLSCRLMCAGLGVVEALRVVQGAVSTSLISFRLPPGSATDPCSHCSHRSVSPAQATVISYTEQTTRDGTERTHLLLYADNEDETVRTDVDDYNLLRFTFQLRPHHATREHPRPVVAPA